MSETNFEQELIAKFESRDSVIGIVGMGYVGLPLMLRFVDEGFRVVGFDVDNSKVESLNQGKSYIAHLPSQQVAAALTKGFESTTDMARVAEVDAIIVCVPTPLGAHREPDLSFVLNTARSIAPHLREGQLVSLESTTYPGTTEDELVPIFEQVGLEIGVSFFVAYSPEREDPANASYSTKTIPKVCGGVSEACRNVACALYRAIIDEVVPVSSPRAAEMTKLLENIHRAVNIGLVNEMKIVADAMSIDIHEVINAAATKPFGFTAYYPGPGLGGHCIPIDPFYLTWKAHEYGLHTRFIELAGEINAGMPNWVVGKVSQALNQRGIALSNSSILVLGIAYKRDVDDMRESPSVEIMELLRDLGADVAYSDPHVPVFPTMREHSFNLTSIALTAKSIAKYDVVLISTNHSDFDYDLILDSAKLIVDTRGVFSRGNSKVIKA